MERNDIIFIIAFVTTGIVLFVLFSIEVVANFFDSLSIGMFEFAVGNPISVYFGAFLISTFGNFTVFLPVPYALAIILLGTQEFVQPLILALICGFGAAIGELSAYAIGRGGRELIEEKYGKRLESMKKLIEKYGFAAIFLFAASPLPDDMLLIPVGVMKYSITKAILAAILGKTVLCLILAYGGRFFRPVVEAIFGGGGIIGTLIGIMGTILLVYLMLRIDWGALLTREKKKEESLEEHAEQG
ncbi:MAG: YqaA family protein [Promethearchaeota archaeon]